MALKDRVSKDIVPPTALDKTVVFTVARSLDTKQTDFAVLKTNT